MAKEQSSGKELMYEDLKLGEKALEVYKATLKKDYDFIGKKYGAEARKAAEQGVDSIRRWNMDNLPTYLNTKEIYRTKDGTVLTTTDLAIAQVLGGVNGFLMSDKGSGKSQLITDIAQAYFNGDWRNKGYSTIQTANNDFRIASIMERRNPDKPTELELTGAHKTCFIGIDELTRAHPIVANEFSDLGNGVYHRGKFEVELGKNGYFLTIATGNDPRKKENRGAMDWDGSMLNRFPVALNLGSERFGISGTKDDSLKTKIKPSTTRVLKCKPRDLTDRIIESYNQILSSSSDLGSEAEAVFYFLSRGASICPGRNGKDPKKRKKDLLPQWPKACVDCSKAKSKKKNSLCSLIDSENGRTLPNARRYAASLDYLLKLKAKDAGRKLDYDSKDIAFLAFELCGGLQDGVLNQGILASNYHNSNEKMMSEVVSELKGEFQKHGDLFVSELEGIKEFGEKYSLVKDKKSETIKPAPSLPEGAELSDNFELVEPEYSSSGTVPWDFASKTIQEQKEEQTED